MSEKIEGTATTSTAENATNNNQNIPTLRDQLVELGQYSQALINDFTVLCGGEKFQDGARKELIKKEINASIEILQTLNNFVDQI